MPSGKTVGRSGGGAARMESLQAFDATESGLRLGQNVVAEAVDFQPLPDKNKKVTENTELVMTNIYSSA